MDELLKLIEKTYGLAGLLLVAPLVGMKFIWSHAQKLQLDLQGALAKVNETHEKRVADAQAISTKLMEMASTHAELSKETNIALERMTDVMSTLQSECVRRPAPVHHKTKKTGTDED